MFPKHLLGIGATPPHPQGERLEEVMREELAKELLFKIRIERQKGVSHGNKAEGTPAHFPHHDTTSLQGSGSRKPGGTRMCLVRSMTKDGSERVDRDQTHRALQAKVEIWTLYY